MITPREEVKRYLREGKDKVTGRLSGRKMTQIAMLTPDDVKELDELNDKIIDNEIERLRLTHQIQAVQHRTNLMGQGWFGKFLEKYKLPYGRDYHVDPDGTVFILD
jgi:hypothetical protein